MGWVIWARPGNESVNIPALTIRIKKNADPVDQGVSGSAGGAGTAISAHSEASAPQVDTTTFETRQLDGSEKFRYTSAK